MPFPLLADAVLILHAGIVAFVVVVPFAVIAGHRLGWRWVGHRRLRGAHLVAIVFVAAQAWFGQVCPLTTLESWLRVQAGAGGYSRSFIEHWLQRLIFYDAPAGVFVAAYTAFAMLVAWVWWRYPPRRGR